MMSNFIQIKQPVWRVDPDALRRHIDLHADLRSQRYQDLASTPAYDQSAAADAAFHTLDIAEYLAVNRFYCAAHELMVIVVARLECLERLLRHPKLLSREPLNVLYAREPFEPDDGPSALYANGAHREDLFTGLPTRVQRRADPKPLVDEISLGIDDHLPSNPVRPGNTPDQHQVLPGHWLNLEYRAARVYRAAPP
jgi:hypothetical protein